MSRPTGTIATKGLELLTFGTPNGEVLDHTTARDVLIPEKATKRPSYWKSSRKLTANPTMSSRVSTSWRISRSAKSLSAMYELSHVLQKEPWFTDKGPNGRIPVLVDHDNGGLGIQEGAAILQYLTRHFDPENKFSFTKDQDLSLCEQWVAWQRYKL